MTDREIWRDVFIPFGVGMASLVWTVCTLHLGTSEAVALLSLPGVCWCSYKLTPFIFAKD